MKRTHLIFWAAMAVFSLTAITAPALAAPPNGRQDGQKGFGNGPRAAFQLSRLARNVGNLDTAGKNRLTAVQAKKILGIIKPLRKQTSLTDDQAKAATDKINVILTAEQKKLITAMKPERRGGGGPGGGMHNGPGGPGGMHEGPGGEGRHQNRGMIENFNPFNPSKDMPMADELSKQCNDMFNKLEKIAGTNAKKPLKK
ncbi:MAG: hypothetical protein WCX65_18780 [bacterium]